VAGSFVPSCPADVGIYPATASTLGLVQPDGSTLAVDDFGVLSVPADTFDAYGSASALASALGTAAWLNVGTAAGDVVQLDPSTGMLPSVDGSQLTNLPAGPWSADTYGNPYLAFGKILHDWNGNPIIDTNYGSLRIYASGGTPGGNVLSWNNFSGSSIPYATISNGGTGVLIPAVGYDGSNLVDTSTGNTVASVTWPLTASGYLDMNGNYITGVGDTGIAFVTAGSLSVRDSVFTVDGGSGSMQISCGGTLTVSNTTTLFGGSVNMQGGLLQLSSNSQISESTWNTFYGAYKGILFSDIANDVSSYLYPTIRADGSVAQTADVLTVDSFGNWFAAAGGGGGSETLDQVLTNGNTTTQSATFGGAIFGDGAFYDPYYQNNIVEITNNYGTSTFNNFLHMNDSNASARGSFLLSNNGSSDWGHAYLAMMIHGLTFPYNIYVTNNPEGTNANLYLIMTTQDYGGRLAIGSYTNTPVTFFTNNLGVMTLVGSQVLMGGLFTGDGTSALQVSGAVTADSFSFSDTISSANWLSEPTTLAEAVSRLAAVVSAGGMSPIP